MAPSGQPRAGVGEGSTEAGGRGADLLAGGALAAWVCVSVGGGQGLRLGSGVGREGWRASPALVVGGHGLAVVECGLFMPWVQMTAPSFGVTAGGQGEHC